MSTINKDEIEKFSRLADEWWDVNGKFKPLHLFNPVRIRYILDICNYNFKLKNKKNFPLKGLKILDIGCGGGLVSEPMCRLGAEVTGIDASIKNIKVASTHAKKNDLNIKYLNSSPEQIKSYKKFDVILNLEIVEHVEDVNLYLESCSKLLKQGGIMFTATINRTFTSYVKAIIGAEYLLRWLPIGTHDWNKFIRPEELEKKINDLNFKTLEAKGLSFNPVFRKWSKSNDLSVNYIIAAKKN